MAIIWATTIRWWRGTKCKKSKKPKTKIWKNLSIYYLRLHTVNVLVAHSYNPGKVTSKRTYSCHMVSSLFYIPCVLKFLPLCGKLLKQNAAIFFWSPIGWNKCHNLAKKRHFCHVTLWQFGISSCTSGRKFSRFWDQ